LDELSADKQFLNDVLFGVHPETKISTPRGETISASAHHEAVTAETINGHHRAPTIVAEFAHGHTGPLDVILVTKPQLTRHQVVSLNESIGFNLQRISDGRLGWSTTAVNLGPHACDDGSRDDYRERDRDGRDGAGPSTLGTVLVVTDTRSGGRHVLHLLIEGTLQNPERVHVLGSATSISGNCTVRDSNRQRNRQCSVLILVSDASLSRRTSRAFIARIVTPCGCSEHREPFTEASQ
jgi:hypothetical protein